MKKFLFLLLALTFIFVGCKIEAPKESVPEKTPVVTEEALDDTVLAERSEVGVGLVKVREADSDPSAWVKQLTFTNGTVAIDGSDATITISGVSPGSGSMTTIDYNNSGTQTQVGDADIVTLNFGVGFDAQESPDTEVDLDFDLSPGTGSATLVAEDDALQVKYDTTDFQESTNGLYLGAAPTITGDLALGAAPASTGAAVGDLLMSNATGIYFEAAPAGTDIAAIVVDSAELLTIGGSGSSGVTITPATTITGALTTGAAIELGHATDTTIARDSAGVISVEGSVVTLLGATIGASEVDADVATQAEIDLKAPLASPTLTGIVTFPIAADPTTDADGEMSFDTDGWGTGYDSLEIWNGTASAYVVATTASDSPTNGQVPKWNTGGTITWENDEDSAGTPSSISAVDTADENAAFYPLLVDGATGTQAVETDGELTYNPSTGVLTVADLDLLGAPFPDDPGADRVLMWDDSEAGAELIWTAAGTGDLLADGTVALSAAWDAGSFKITAQDLTADTGDVTVGDDILLADGAVVGITGNEVITFNAAGSINVTGATMDVDGAFTASTVASDGAVSGTTITGTGKLSTIVTTEQLRLGYDATNYLTATLAADGHTTIATEDPDGAEADINFTPDGNVGIKTAAPSTALEVTGTVTATAFAGAVTGNVTGDLTGTADLATTVTISDDEATNDEHEVAFTTDNLNLESDGDLTYNPSTGVLTVPDMDLLGAPFPDDPGADRVLTWDDSATGAELVWGTSGSGDLLADGSVPLTQNWDVGSFKITAQDLTADTGDVTVGDDIILADGAVVGIAANEIITFNAAGTIAISGADLAIGSNPADAGTGIRMSNNTVIEFEDTEGTGEVTALQVDATEAILIGDANASGVTLVPNTSVSGTLTADVGLTLSDGAVLDQSANNLVEITENSDYIRFNFDGTDVATQWSDGTLNLATTETNVDGIMYLDGNGTGQGILRVRAADDTDYIGAYHDDTDGWVAASSGDIILAPDGDVDDYVHVSTATNVTSISVVGSTGTLGTAAAEWDALYLNDSGVVYGENDQSNTITSSATAWTFNQAIVAVDATFSGTTTVTTLEQNSTAQPEWEFNDSGAAGADAADEETAQIVANMTTTTEDAEVGDLWFNNMQAGTRTTVLLDGSAASIEAENVINAEAGITSSNGTTGAGFIDLYEDEDSANDYYIRLQAPTITQGGNITLTLPTTDGAANEILKTDGNGVLSWTSAGTATAWDDLVAPDADETLAMTDYTTQWTWTETAADMLSIFATGAFGDISVMVLDQNTGNATNGTMLEIVTEDADVDHLVLALDATPGGASEDYVIHKIATSGTYTIDVTSDGTAAVDFVDSVTLTGGTNILESVDIDLSDNTEIVNITADANNYDAGSGIFTIYDDSAGETSVSYLIRGAREADGDIHGAFLLFEDNSTGAAANGDEMFSVKFGGSTYAAGGYFPVAADGGTLGSDALDFSDIFLATGGVINLGSGDVTLTHAANTLAFAGATSSYTFDDAIDITSSEGLILENDETITNAVNGTIALSGNLATAASASPEILLTDSTTSGEAKILVADAAGPDATMDLQVDVAGTLTTYLQLDGINEQLDISAASTLGDGGTTNYTAVSATGAITQAGSATLTLQDGSDFIISANANAGPYLANSGDTGTGDFDLGGAELEIPNTNSGDQALDTEGEIGYKSDEDLIILHGGTAGEGQGEHGFSVLEHLVLTLDPAWAYDQESTYRSVPIMYLGDDWPHGFTMTEWKVFYVGGDPTTELDADIICDTTPDYNTAAGATVMDVVDTTAGASTADTGFDSGTCANGSMMYLHFGADPTDANVLVTIDIWGYAEED